MVKLAVCTLNNHFFCQWLAMCQGRTQVCFWVCLNHTLLPYQRVPVPTQHIPLCSLVGRKLTQLVPRHFCGRSLIEIARHFLGIPWDLASAQLKCTQKRFNQLLSLSHTLPVAFAAITWEGILELCVWAKPWVGLNTVPLIRGNMASWGKPAL